MQLATCYFHYLFTASEARDASRIFNNVEKIISYEMNVHMIRPFKEEEIWVAVKDMAHHKAPRIDGFSTLFYNKYLHILGADVTSYYLVVLKSEIAVKDINKTHIILILKVVMRKTR
ncbi:hypothetical protein J1N35_022847 [Gossypium stocksii]|uniref:Uncharacterized protein n=1 Tax=Gossypium stocksii TaxID=47602 RepID=A0A9D3VHY4_9ROSI|nr:hypothetical protein J1N35_022847 [Gossypium stocksii]